MKYKIGELKVEAVQWNYNTSEILKFAGLGSTSLVGVSSIFLHIGDFETELEINDYLVKVSEDKFFSLPASQFEKIATKVKEPKFKVGDKVYRIKHDNCAGDIEEYNIEFIRFIISKISNKDGVINYNIEGGGELIILKEDILFTLEEAIEKLKEL